MTWRPAARSLTAPVCGARPDMNRHHKRALAVLGFTGLLDVVFGILYGLDDHIGIWHGLYCATGTATSLGCDVLPADGTAYVLSTLMMLTILPLFAAIFSLFTTGLVASHADDKTDRQTDDLKRHVDQKTATQTDDLKDHISGA